MRYFKMTLPLLSGHYGACCPVIQMLFQECLVVTSSRECAMSCNGGMLEWFCTAGIRGRVCFYVALETQTRCTEGRLNYAKSVQGEMLWLDLTKLSKGGNCNQDIHNKFWKRNVHSEIDPMLIRWKGAHSKIQKGKKVSLKGGSNEGKQN